MNIRYETWVGLPPGSLLTALLDLLAGVFVNQTRTELLIDLSYHHNRTPLLTLLAIDNEAVVGCKLGYERQPGHFYSWLGCVDPAHRGEGIATELMRQQHDWCRQQGYQSIRTQTYNQWRSMLLLNIRSGFDIVGTVQGTRGLTIVMEKKLA